ncbi:hypothetical protein [uncultured Ruegeria sp.]|uniref:hypothetical protein n=1 Tax=uncultured Ruegeria sp. TaxID=259304 RepID=UPI00263482C0|nr:hypothetical protein [uncultured Ruegeria sp.]
MSRLIFAVVVFCGLSLLPVGANADVSLNDAFAACEASVVESTNTPLLSLGVELDHNERGQRIRLDTVEGTLVADVFPSPVDNVTGCILWGKSPVLEAEYANDWQDWAEWDEVEEAARAWYDSSLKVAGSADLTDSQQPGFVVARCAEREYGIVLAAQPAIAGVLRQVSSDLDPPPSPRTFFQFSVMRALPGRCQAAVDAHSER